MEQTSPVLEESSLEDDHKNYSIKEVKDIPYYLGDDRNHKKHGLNVYYPEVEVHGGDCFGKVGQFFAKEGFVTVVISYRLAPWNKHPAHVIDVARSTRWVKDNISEYHGDLNRVYICGHSAGGHLATLVTLDHHYLESEGVERNFIKGVVGLCGIYDLHLFAQGGIGWTSYFLGFFFRNAYLRLVFGFDAQIWTDASPIKYVHNNAPPFLLLNAESDFGLEVHTHALAEKLKSQGIIVETGVVKGTNHGSLIGQSIQYIGLGPPKETTSPVIAFLTKLALAK